MGENEGKVVAPISGSSSTGAHFVNEYQDCPRRWYLHYELGIVPRYTGKALTFGLAWHKAIEVFYGSGGDEHKGFVAGLGVLLDAKDSDKYQYPEDYETDRCRFPSMYDAWVEQIGKVVLAKYNVLSLEETLSVELPNGMHFTGRLDELLEDKESGAVVIAEHKSTTFSLTEMERGVFVGDQVCGYMTLVRECKPELANRLQGCLLDVTYQRGSKIEARLSTLYYENTESARLLINVTGVLNELSQKITAVRSGVPDALLFPRNGLACSRFKCPYEPICRHFVKRGCDLPDTLVQLPTVPSFDPELEIDG
jgi:hypothetical protein